MLGPKRWYFCAGGHGASTGSSRNTELPVANRVDILISAAAVNRIRFNDLNGQIRAVWAEVMERPSGKSIEFRSNQLEIFCLQIGWKRLVSGSHLRDHNQAGNRKVM
jgi:hypothetical protein